MAGQVSGSIAILCGFNADGELRPGQVDENDYFYVNTVSSTVDASDVTYTPSTLADWDGGADPGNVDGALDQLAERVKDNETWITGGGLAFACVRDEKSNGTDGGGSTSGDWYERDLNTVHYDPHSIVSIASNRFTLGAGSYLIEGYSPIYRGAGAQVRIYDVSNSAAIEYGQSCRISNANIGFEICQVSAYVVLTESTIFSLEYQVGNSQASDGLGVACGFGNTEVYSEVKITKFL